MIEVVLLVAAVMVGLVVVMRMDVEPREPAAPAEAPPEPTEGLAADSPGD